MPEDRIANTPTSYRGKRVYSLNAWLKVWGATCSLEKEEPGRLWTARRDKDDDIVPRYQQWESGHHLIYPTARRRAEALFEIQHSAGSGKSNSNR